MSKKNTPTFIGDVIETGDVSEWPIIMDWYSHSNERWRLLSQIPVFWRHQTHLVVPLLRNALQDAHDYDYALEAASYFPELLPDVIDSLSNGSMKNCVTEKEIVGALAHLLGFIDYPVEYITIASEEGRNKLHMRVDAAIKSRFSKNLQDLLTNAL